MIGVVKHTKIEGELIATPEIRELMRSDIPAHELAKKLAEFVDGAVVYKVEDHEEIMAGAR